jgi:hypothetical protein
MDGNVREFLFIFNSSQTRSASFGDWGVTASRVVLYEQQSNGSWGPLNQWLRSNVRVRTDPAGTLETIEEQ